MTDKQLAASISSHEGKKYLCRIFSAAAEEAERSILIDVYSVIEAFGVSCPARAHAIKKLLCAGVRGKGSAVDDLQGVLAATNRAIELELGRIRLEESPEDQDCWESFDGER